jgi:sugar/nucleoside kinase (ribokinase family)
VTAVPEPTSTDQHAHVAPPDVVPGRGPLDVVPGGGAPGGGPLDVVGMGNALVDVLAAVPDRVLSDLSLARGSMELVDLGRAERIYEAVGPAVEVSGGSAANTVAGVAALGGTSGFIGKVADDDMGEVFVHDMRACGVELHAAIAGAEGGEAELRGTGRSLVLVTSDAERTMATHLGVSATLGPADVPAGLVARAGILYLEGYLWDRPSAKEAMRRAVQVAHENDRSVALSLSDSFCVDRHRNDFLDLVLNDVDVLFGNEEELLRLFGARSLDHALSAAEDTGVLVAATLGPRGSVVVGGRGPVEVAAAPAPEIVDKTGAGDMYASGFLYGLTHGHDPIDCARLGSLCAAEVIGHLGARPQHDLAALARVEGFV